MLGTSWSEALLSRDGLRRKGKSARRLFTVQKCIILYLTIFDLTYHLSYSIYKHDAIDIADPSSMQDVYHHMNFVIDLAH